jgi:hypothetical protein
LPIAPATGAATRRRLWRLSVGLAVPGVLDLAAVDVGYEQLSARILRPGRPRLAEARAAVAGITDPREAWEVLATRGVIPSASLDAARPYFVTDHCHGCGGRGVGGCGGCGGAGFFRCEAPPTVAAALALAAAPAAIETTEALAREAGRRLKAVLGRNPRAIAWHVVRRRGWSPASTPPAIDATRQALEYALRNALVEAADRDARALRRRRREVAGVRPEQLARRCAEDAAAWRRATECRARVPPGRVWTPVFAGCSFGRLASPFEPLLEIWRQGSSLEGFTSQLIVLAASEIADDE